MISAPEKKKKAKKQMTNKQSILLTLNVSFEKSSFQPEVKGKGK